MTVADSSRWSNTGARRAIRRNARAAVSSAARFVAIVAICAFVTSPLWPVLAAAFLPGAPGSRRGDGGPLAGILDTFRFTPALTWLGNSLLVATTTTAVAIVIAAPAAYALSRGRGRLVAAYSLVLFVVQSLPVVVLVALAQRLLIRGLTAGSVKG